MAPKRLQYQLINLRNVPFLLDAQIMEDMNVFPSLERAIQVLGQ